VPSLAGTRFSGAVGSITPAEWGNVARVRIVDGNTEVATDVRFFVWFERWAGRARPALS
jgi:hypothetical protein